MLKQLLGYVTILGLTVLSCPVMAAQMTPRQALYYHAHQGNINALVQLQKMGYPIDVSDDYGNSALCEAVIKQDQRAIRTLIQAGADTNASCMQALSSEVKDIALPKDSAIPVGTDQQSKFASPQISQVPNPPAEPLSKNTKVGIGLGVVTLAAVGGGIAALSSGGGGGKSDPVVLACVDGVQDGEICKCNIHATGRLCELCEVGYGLYGTNSCHKTLHCDGGTHQYADQCVTTLDCVDGKQIGSKCQCSENATGPLCNSCKSGYEMHGNQCLLTCAPNAYAQGEQCVCDEGYSRKYNTDASNLACYKDLNCKSFVNTKQENGVCVCKDIMPGKEYVLLPGGCFEKITCPSGSSQVNDKCSCNPDTPVPTYEGGVLIACNTCGVEGATWDGTQCNCPANKPVAERNPSGALTSCTECPSGTTYIPSTNSCSCGLGKILYDNQCYTDLHCENLTHSTGNQLGNYCECHEGYKGSSCSECADGYANVGDVCSMVNKKADYNASTGTVEITMTNTNNETLVGLYGQNETVQNVFAGDSVVTGTINITNTGTGDIYGVYGNGSAFGLYKSNSSATKATSNIVLNNSGSTAYGIYAMNNAYGLFLNGPSAVSNISITDNSGGTIYGIYSKEGDVYGSYTEAGSASGVSFNMNIRNKGGIATGLYSATGAANALRFHTSNSHINLYQWGGKAYGMQGVNVHSRVDDPSEVTGVKADITMYLVGESEDGISSGEIIGMSSFPQEGQMTVHKNDEINLHLIGGNYTMNSTPVSVDTDNTRAVGIYADTGVSVVNKGDINIDRPSSWTDDKGTTDTSDDDTYKAGTTGRVYGIYVKGGATQTITNEGQITISGEYDKAYGIYVENGNGVTVENSGTITVNSMNGYGVYFKNGEGGRFKNTSTGKIIAASDSCQGTNCYISTRAFIPNGAATGDPPEPDPEPDPDPEPLVATSLKGINLASMGVKVLAGTGCVFETEGAITGPLYMDLDTVSSGFNTVYTEKDMILAGDTSNLHLISESALFDAKLADNGHDVVMTMKSFDTTTTNKSLSDFLSKNYALKNNEAFYNKLKSFGQMDALTESLNRLTGKGILSRFNFEDMTMMRELNFDMNEKLFHNKDQHFALAGSVTPMAFKGDVGSNARYSLFNKRDAHKSIGLGVAFTNTRSNDVHEENDRRETSYQLILPMGYKMNGLNLLTSPRIGYARGTYDRTGFDERTYDGVIEKRVFGLMNEARYPMTIGKWTFEPTVEFNILGYQQKGHEDAKEFALNIQNQNTLSVEGGIGLYATREEELDKDSTLKLMLGIVAYHEFLDPYRVKVGMNGMEGAFILRDEKRSDNRSVVRAGFDYVYRDLSLYGTLISYVDKEARTSAKTGMKIKF